MVAARLVTMIRREVRYTFVEVLTSCKPVRYTHQLQLLRAVVRRRFIMLRSPAHAAAVAVETPQAQIVFIVHTIHKVVVYANLVRHHTDWHDDNYQHYHDRKNRADHYKW